MISEKLGNKKSARSLNRSKANEDLTALINTAKIGAVPRNLRILVATRPRFVEYRVQKIFYSKSSSCKCIKIEAKEIKEKWDTILTLESCKNCQDYPYTNKYENIVFIADEQPKPGRPKKKKK